MQMSLVGCLHNSLPFFFLLSKGGWAPGAVAKGYRCQKYIKHRYLFRFRPAAMSALGQRLGIIAFEKKITRSYVVE